MDMHQKRRQSSLRPGRKMCMQDICWHHCLSCLANPYSPLHLPQLHLFSFEAGDFGGNQLKEKERPSPVCTYNYFSSRDSVLKTHFFFKSQCCCTKINMKEMIPCHDCNMISMMHKLPDFSSVVDILYSWKCAWKEEHACSLSYGLGYISEQGLIFWAIDMVISAVDRLYPLQPGIIFYNGKFSFNFNRYL